MGSPVGEPIISRGEDHFNNRLRTNDCVLLVSACTCGE
jgi:hypothetical protein